MAVNKYVMEEWDEPKRLPGGVAIPTTSMNEFLHYFMNIDERIWEMTQAQRETWKNEIIYNWERFRRVLYRDGTGSFHQQLKDMHRMGGGIILVAGDMGTGKSIFGMSVAKIWNVLNKNPNPLHIFWSKNEIRAKIRKTDPNTAHIIDEDMKATGSGAANLELHLKNLFESIRKTGKLVLLIGVNAQPSRLGRAIGLQIFPIGFNRRFQANRFIVCNWKGEPLWIAITQRFYYPVEKAVFEGELGYLGEYTDRALEFSNTMTGVFSGSNAEQEKEWSKELVKAWNNSEWAGDNVKPPMDVLEYLAIQIEIPPESIASIRRVCAVSKMIIGKSENSKRRTAEGLQTLSGEGWTMFREGLQLLSIKYGEGKREQERDAEALSWFYTPKAIEDGKEWKYKDVRREMGLSIAADSLGTQIRRLHSDIPTKEIGDLGEVCVTSWLDSLGATRSDSDHQKAGSKGLPDILCTVGKTEVAVNVKTTLEDNYREHIPTTPEYNWKPYALIALIVPRRLSIALFPITTRKQTVNLNEGRLSTPGGVSNHVTEMIKEMIEG